ncbi:MAG TPA: aminopeptidase P N-terminal domain-containing protein [Candidatus Saccharimonadales bacterium]|nr:aminopeptidase P N-terminal domain-containing protein [Candidatus Saccharimonadales bacterium]
MESHFTANFFKGNRQRLRQLLNTSAPIAIAANGLVQRGGDTTFNFAQDAVFWYLCGINEPDLTLIMEPSGDYLIVPPRSVTRETFDGAIDVKQLSSLSGVTNVMDDREGWEKFTLQLKKNQQVALLSSPGDYIQSFGFYTNPARAALEKRVQQAKRDLEILDISATIAKMRTVKQPEEISAIQHAIDVTSESLRELAMPSKIKDYKYEFQVEAELTRGMRDRGLHHAFTPIIAGGKRACTLHNISNEGRLNRSDLVIIDTGAEAEHYAADITRTIHLGRPSKRQLEVHAAVKEVQQYTYSIIRPGILMRDFEHQVEDFMGQKLKQLGLLTEVTHEGVRRYYPHATSHFMGLNVHDSGDYSSPLPKGTVMTVEPGIYILEEGIGVRIEDDVLITDKGIQVLSSQLPTTMNLN